MTESAAIPLNYSIKRRRWLTIPKVVKALAVCAVIAISWRPTRSRLIELQVRNEARSAALAKYQTCLKYAEPAATVAYDEMQEDLPIEVEDELHGGVARWISTRADTLGATTRPSWNGCLFRGVPHVAAQNEIAHLWKFYETAHGRIICANSFRQFHNVVIQKKGGYFARCGYYPAIFLHARDGGAGERLVCLHFDATTFRAGDPFPIAIEVWRNRTVVGPKPLTSSRIALPFNCPARDPLALHFGQADPGDPSHFTIQFSAGIRHGTIHGWLRPDDTVFLESDEQ